MKIDLSRDLIATFLERRLRSSIASRRSRNPTSRDNRASSQTGTIEKSELAPDTAQTRSTTQHLKQRFSLIGRILPQPAPPSVRTTKTVSSEDQVTELQKTKPVASSSSSTPAQTQNEGEQATVQTGGRVIRTPFGTYSPDTPRKVFSSGGGSGDRVYFRTHQPAEYRTNPQMRTKFAEIYGEKALVTLDWVGTVPENINPVWVTNRPVDETGRPLPSNKVHQLRELT